MSNSRVSLVGNNLSREHGESLKWNDSIAALDGCVYGIPFNARRVIRFNPNPEEYSSVPIGTDLGGGWKWYGGVEAGNGCIYAVPWGNGDGTSILKLHIRNQVVERLNVELPDPDVDGLRWGYGALADDGCLYFFPCDARRILKIDPSDDTVCSVGDDLGEGVDKFFGTVKAHDGCLIGIPDESKCVMKFDPNDPETTSIVGQRVEEDFKCYGNSALGNDGNIYALDRDGKVLQIDVANNTHSFVTEAPQRTKLGWCGGVAGMDGNIYFIPDDASRVLMYDVVTKKALFVGKDIGNGKDKYSGGVLNPADGKIYCLPYNAERVLAIDTNIQSPSHQNNNARTRTTHDQGIRGGTASTKTDLKTSPRDERRRIVADQHRVGTSSIQNVNNDDVMIPHVENINAMEGGGNASDAQSTMQKLFQLSQFIQHVRGMDNPHPTLLANAERMAEASTILTDRLLEQLHIQDQNQNDNKVDKK